MPDYEKQLKRRRLIKTIFEERGDMTPYKLQKVLIDEYGKKVSVKTLYSDIAELVNLTPEEEDSITVNLSEIMNSTMHKMVALADKVDDPSMKIKALKDVMWAVNEKQKFIQNVARKTIEKSEDKEKDVTSIVFADEVVEE